MKTLNRVALLAILLTVCVLGVIFTLWFDQDKPLDFHLYRRSECTFRGTVLKSGAVFKEGCEQCTCIGNDNLQCQTVKGCVQDDKIHVVITSDEHTLGGLITLVNSIYHNTNASVVYHLIITQDSQQHLKRWMNEVPLKHLKYDVIVFPEEWVSDKIVARGSRQDLERPINYARTYLPRLLQEVHGKIIYIDADCVVQGNIAELWKTKLQPGHIAAFSGDCSHMSKHGNMFNEKDIEQANKEVMHTFVGDLNLIVLSGNRLASYLNFNHPLIQSVGLRPETCSFNTGVFVTDLELWRHYNITDRLEFWMKANYKEEVYGNREGGGGQQPPFLIVFHDKYTELDPFWNVRQLGSNPGVQYSKEFLRKAHLLHWNGQKKPWDLDSRNTNMWDKFYIPDPLRKFHITRKFKTKS